MVTQSSIHCKKGVRIKQISEGRLIAFLAPCSETQYYHNTVAGRNRQSRKMKPSMEEDIVQFPRDKKMAFELATLCFLVLRWRYVSQMCLRGSCVIFFLKMKLNYCRISTIARKRLSTPFRCRLNCGIVFKTR